MKRTANIILDKIKEELVVRSTQYSEHDDLPAMSFSHYRAIYSWSHKVKLTYDDTQIYLITARGYNKKELEEFRDKTYSDNEASYKIPINNAEEAIELLLKYDTFIRKF